MHSFDMCMQDLFRAADSSSIKLLLRRVVAFHNVDSVTYVTIDNIMQTPCILLSHRAVAF